jgi:hypothetical protein
MSGVFFSKLAIQGVSVPILKTSEYCTISTESSQIILIYSPSSVFFLQGFSVYVWDTSLGAITYFGNASLEIPFGNKIYTSQLTSMGMGKDLIQFSESLIIQAGQQICITCSPSGPINMQTWQGNLIGYANLST